MCARAHGRLSCALGRASLVGLRARVSRAFGPGDPLGLQALGVSRGPPCSRPSGLRARPSLGSSGPRCLPSGLRAQCTTGLGPESCFAHVLPIGPRSLQRPIPWAFGPSVSLVGLRARVISLGSTGPWCLSRAFGLVFFVPSSARVGTWLPKNPTTRTRGGT